MDIVINFKEYLLSLRDKPSKITIKNYLSDVRKFILWCENKYSTHFSPNLITDDLIASYEKAISHSDNSSAPAARSAKRYISSLRKFCAFLEHSRAIKANPFSFVQAAKPIEDPWQLKIFTNHLFTSKASRLTIKNYIIDIKQFILWLEKVTSITSINSDRFNSINNDSLEQYKLRLISEDHFSSISINRKLSSLRRYIRWLYDRGLLNKEITKNQILDNSHTQEPKIEISSKVEVDLPLTALHNVTHKDIVKSSSDYSGFAPIRLAQKSGKIITLGKDLLILYPVSKTIEAINYALWKRSGKKVFTPVKTILGIKSAVPEKQEQKIANAIVSKLPEATAKAASLVREFVRPASQPKLYSVRNISKSFYAPLQISLKELNWKQRVLHHLKYTRPTWYRTYHTFPIVHHIHLAILILATTVAGIGSYYSINEGQQGNKPVLAALPESPPRTVAFQGRLLDKSNNPITAETNLRFALYNSPVGSGSAMLWQEKQNVTPSEDGYFVVNLGKIARISQQLFINNPNLYVGIAVAGESELQPRQQLPTTGLASNSQTLQGLKAITKTDKTANVVLALDSSGDLTIGGTASPTFQATGGQFSFSGQSLLFTTNPGSNGNIDISPDGSGIINLSKPVQNISNYISGAGVPGAVAIDDLLAVSTTSSSHSALTVKQNSSGDIISGYNNNIARFRLESTGNVMIGGNLSLNGNTITTTNASFGIANTSVTNLSIGTSATVISLGGISGNTIINNSLTVKDTTTLNGSVLASGLLTAAGGLTVAPGKIITLSDFAPGAITFINSLSQLTQDTNFAWSPIPKSLNIIGSLCLRSSSGACSGSTPGTIYASNATVQSADLAENYISSQVLEPGDVVIPEAMGNNLAVVKSQNEYQPQVIGIISTKPGFTLNADAQPESEHPYLYPLALQGRVPVKVSTINGVIHAGDPLTSSSIPGVAMKATKSGQIIARALEDYTNPKKDAITKIIAFVNISYNSPQSIITDSGDLKIASINPIVDNINNEYDNTIAIGEPLDSATQLIKVIEASIIDAKEISTNSLRVATDTIIINGVHINDYISNIVDQTVKPYLIASNINIALSPTPIPLSLTVTNIKPESNISTQSAQSNNFLDEIKTASSSQQPSVLASKSAEIKEDQLSNQNFIGNLKSTSFYNDLMSPASSAAELGIDTLDTKEASVSKTFSVLGRTTLSDVGITGKISAGLLTIDGLNENPHNSQQAFASINTSNGPLKFQSDGFNGIDFINGKITIDTQGNLKAANNAYFAKDVSIKGTLAANIIAPVPGSDLIFKLDDKDASVAVENKYGSQVLNINQHGDISSSGSAKFTNLNIIRGAQADTSNTQTIAQGSAGQGVISAKQKERTLITPFVTKQSLIYVTATSDTQGVNLYVARQTPEGQGNKGSFTIQIPQIVARDIKFNWWIVN